MASKINLKNCVLKIKDAGANEITIKFGDGNLTWTKTKNRNYTLDRGNLDDVIDGDDAPVEVKFEAVYIYIKASTATTPAIPDVLDKVGEAAAWVTSDADTCKPYSVKLEFTHTPVCGSQQQERVLFSTFRYESLDFDPKAGTISCSGKSNETGPTISRFT